MCVCGECISVWFEWKTFQMWWNMNTFTGKWCYNNGNPCSLLESCHPGTAWGYPSAGGSTKGREGEWGKMWSGTKE